MERSTSATVTSSDKAGAQRQHHRAREPARRAEVADGQRQLGPTRPGDAPGRPGDGAAQRKEHGENADHAEAVVKREIARFRGEDRERHQQQGGSQRERDNVPARPDALRRHLVAEQHAGAHLLGPPQRPQRKQQRHQQPVAHRRQQAAGADREVGLDRQGIADRGRQRDGNEKAERDAEHDADQRDHHHLQQVDPQDRPAGGAQALEGGDDLAAAIDVGGDRIGDADAADRAAR
jgi:hypothetical protein